MKLVQLFEELTKSIKVVTNYQQGTTKYIKIFLLTPEHYKEDLDNAYEDSREAVGRYIADTTTEEVYAFSSDALHEEVITALGLSPHYDKVIRGYYYKARNGEFITDEQRSRRLPWVTKYLKYRSHDSRDY